MRYIRLTEEHEKGLSKMHKYSPYILERRRSHCLLLSHAGKSINELASIFKVSRLAVTRWMDQWEAAGLDGITHRPGRGRKKKLASLDRSIIEGYVADNARNLTAVLELLEKNHAVKVSKKTLQRFLKTGRL